MKTEIFPFFVTKLLFPHANLSGPQITEKTWNYFSRNFSLRNLCSLRRPKVQLVVMPFPQVSKSISPKLSAFFSHQDLD